MLDAKVNTILAVAQERNFTRAAQVLGLTQPAVSHHIQSLEDELGIKLFVRKNGEFHPTAECETVIRYAKQLRATNDKMLEDIKNHKKHVTRLRVGFTHTAESGLIAEVLAKYAALNEGVSITVTSDSMKNLYDMMENMELDLAMSWGKPQSENLNSLMLDTDYLVCAVAPESKLAKQSMVTLEQLKRENLILRTQMSATRNLFETTLESIGESIEEFNITLEVDNVATIKDLVRKGLGVSILAQSSCMDEVRKGKMFVLPIENLGMVRESTIIYRKDFSHTEILNDITKIYKETLKKYYARG